MDEHGSEFLESSSSQGCQEAVRHLEHAIMEGKGWFTALLETMSLWTVPEEIYQGRYYRYLIAGEAFDWLLLAGRLAKEVDGLISEEDKKALFQYGRPPDYVTEEEFKRLLGAAKYRGYLNYYYGITVEKAIAEAVEKEIQKERLSKGYQGEKDLTEEAFSKVYSASRNELLKTFRKEKMYPNRRSMTPSESKEFTYWLFKYRLKMSDKVRLASDTKKGLEQLHRTSGKASPSSI